MDPAPPPPEAQNQEFEIAAEAYGYAVEPFAPPGTVVRQYEMKRCSLANRQILLNTVLLMT